MGEIRPDYRENAIIEKSSRANVENLIFETIQKVTALEKNVPLDQIRKFLF